MGQNIRLLSAMRLPKVLFQYTLIPLNLQAQVSTIFIFYERHAILSRLQYVLGSSLRHRGIIFNHHDWCHLAIIAKWIID